jgi:hypothetical protein
MADKVKEAVARAVKVVLTDRFREHVTSQLPEARVEIQDIGSVLQTAVHIKAANVYTRTFVVQVKEVL